MRRTGPSEQGDTTPPEVPDHQLLRWIGRGSYGDVWLALNAMHKWCAVKVVFRQSEDGRAYEQEFRGLKRYDDLAGTGGSLMPIKDVGENKAKGYFYYAMELADDANTRLPLPRLTREEAVPEKLAGVAASYEPWTLSVELKRRGRLPLQECIEHGIALASALEQIHAGKLVHRDVKPANIIFVAGKPKLADVGLMAKMDATLMSFAGTEGFVPPEGPGGEGADIFALGKVLYMMATGRLVREFPQEATDFDRLADAEREQVAELQAVFDRACDPDRKDRHGSARQLREELEMRRAGVSVLRMRQLEIWVRRGKWAAAVGVPVATLLFLLLAFGAWRARVVHEATVAELQATKLSRMLVRKAGWSQSDWERVEKASKLRLDDAIVSQAVSTMSGLDARMVSHWRGAEASSVAFAPDGRVLFTGMGTNRAMLISHNTNRVELPVMGEGQACWSPEGVPLVWQQGTNACLLREAQTGKVWKEFLLAPGEKVAQESALVMAATPDASLVAAALVGKNGARVVVWDARDGRLLGEIALTVRAMTFSPEGSLFAMGDELGGTTVCSTQPFAILAKLTPGKRPNAINCLAFGEDRVVPREGTNETKRWLLAVGDSGAGIVIWDLTKRLPRTFCSGSDYNIQSLAFSPDGLSLASAGRSYVRVWDLMSGLPLLQITGAGGSDTPALAYDPTGERLAVGTFAASSASFVGLVELEQHRGIQRLRGLNFKIRKAWFSPNSRLIAALSDDWSLAVWETDSGRLRHLFEVAGVLADNAGGAFDAAGTKFGFAAGHEARLYDLQSGQALGKWSLPHGYSEEVQFDAQNRLLLVRRQPSLENPNTWRWILYELPVEKDALTLHQQMDFGYRTVSMTFPIPASQFVAMTKDRSTGLDSVRAFDVQSGNQLWQVAQHRNTPWDRFAPSANPAWCGFGIGTNNLTQIVRVADGAFIFSLPEWCYAIDPFGSNYAAQSYSPEYSHEQWFLKSVKGSNPPMLLGFDGQHIGDTFTFSPDGQRVAWGATDGTVLLADISVVSRRLSKLGWK